MTAGQNTSSSNNTYDSPFAIPEPDFRDVLVGMTPDQEMAYLMANAQAIQLEQMTRTGMFKALSGVWCFPDWCVTDAQRDVVFLACVNICSVAEMGTLTAQVVTDPVLAECFQRGAAAYLGAAVRAEEAAAVRDAGDTLPVATADLVSLSLEELNDLYNEANEDLGAITDVCVHEYAALSTGARNDRYGEMVRLNARINSLISVIDAYCS